MRRLNVFESISADGFFCDASGDMAWAHKSDPEWNAFVGDNASGNGELLLGRVTYDMMASFWPTPAALAMNRKVAEGINRLPKVVVSRTLEKADWQNTRVARGNLVEEVRRMKQAPGGTIVVLGSGSIVAQLAGAGLVDEYQLALNPVVLGKGRTLFEGMEKQLGLKLARSRVFGNGNVFLCYEPS
jgi:dihydrofolate reductase